MVKKEDELVANYLQEREQFFLDTEITEPNAKQTDILNLQVLTNNIRRWAVERNLHTADPSKQALKFGEEAGELFEGLAKGDMDLVRDAIGDIFVVLTILSMQIGYSIESNIELAYDEIKDRKGRMIDGVFVKESDLK